MADMRAFYDRGDEQGRLGDWGRLEFLRTRELLSRFLPAPPAVVLDVGVATGAYALPLATEAYEVHPVGPLYHLTRAADRDRVLREAQRVLRPGGLLAAAAITRFASTFDGVARGFLLEPGFEEIVERDLADGQHRNPDSHPRWFTTGYLARSAGIRQGGRVI
jgi:SAM-dependent methyltransferase